MKPYKQSYVRWASECIVKHNRFIWIVMFFLFWCVEMNLLQGKVYLAKFGVWYYVGTAYGADSTCGPHFQEEELNQGMVSLYFSAKDLF